MKLIPLTQGQFAKVDDRDYEWLTQWKWCASLDQHTQSYYAVRSVKLKGGGQRLLGMHRFILGIPKSLDVDHRDHDTLNNQRRNLRKATKSQNGCNKPKQRNNTSGYKGVTWHKHDKKFQAQIQVNGRHIYLGQASSAFEAHLAYEKAAKKYFGEFRYKGAA